MKKFFIIAAMLVLSIQASAQLVITKATILDKWANVIPELVIVLFICLAKSGKLLSNLLGDVV